MTDTTLIPTRDMLISDEGGGNADIAAIIMNCPTLFIHGSYDTLSIAKEAEVKAGKDKFNLN